MAAVAAEPGAAAASTTTAGDGAEPEPEILQPAEAEAKLEAEATKECAPVMEPALPSNSRDAPQDCSLVTETEGRPRPEPEAAGKPQNNPAEDGELGAQRPGGGEAGAAPTDHESGLEGLGDRGKDSESRGEDVEGSGEVSSHGPRPTPTPGSHRALPRHSDPAPAPAAAMESPGPAVGEPGGTTEPDRTEPADTEIEGGNSVPVQPRTGSGPGEEGDEDEDGNSAEVADGSVVADAAVQPCGTPEHIQMDPCDPSGTDREQKEAPTGETDSPSLGSEPPATPVEEAVHGVVKSEAPELPSHHADPETRLDETESKDLVAGGGDPVVLRPESLSQLIPGSEVRVCLDHIIDDALVVSFRLGEKTFSGVLMDLSKRFGPYGIPVTVFPKRNYRDKPESMQLTMEPFQPQAEQGPQDALLAPPQDPASDPAAPAPPPPPPLPPPSLCTSKPPPLFQEGAPYPPPLFIRDTYNQSLPQPLPRKIRRPKRKLYREEPTSIMNAIKLRPRQVLCDKCKGAVVSDKREVRKGHGGGGGDCRGDDAKRRRSNNESVASVSKRPRTEPRVEERGRAPEGGPRRQGAVVRVSAVAHTKSGGGGGNNNRGIVKVPPSSGPSPAHGGARAQLSTKKVLQSKNVDHSKVREVLKMARAQKRQRETSGRSITATSKMTATAAAAAAASTHQDALPKVHFTRRLHQISGGGGAGNSTPLPPRIRLKPQRYRNEENDSSSCKPGLEKVTGCGGGGGGGCRGVPKTTPPRCPSTRSSSISSSSSCSSCFVHAGGEASTASESQGPARGPDSDSESEPKPKTEPESQTQTHPQQQPQPQPCLELPLRQNPQPEHRTEPDTQPQPEPEHKPQPEPRPYSEAQPEVVKESMGVVEVPEERVLVVVGGGGGDGDGGGVGGECGEGGGREERRERRGGKAGNLTVFMSLNQQSKADSCSGSSVCSVDSADDLKSTNSECSSTETLDFPPPGVLHTSATPPDPSTSSSSSSSLTPNNVSSSSSSSSSSTMAASSKDDKKLSKSLKGTVFSKNVSKCVTPDGRTICVGDIVWAKIYGFPWWPARILAITVSRKDSGLLVRQEARISWFGSPTTSFLALSQLSPFLENFQSRFNKKRKGLYRKAITEAAKAAKQLTPEVRALLTQFET
ncbi:PWWP domain-containing protein 2A [Amia ocellicauda]|uniref:PWWP domain-containing protein 2A n=1 Tax=Amia ocellicauda TaxID=2972642 RepID=UPI003463C920